MLVKQRWYLPHNLSYLRQTSGHGAYPMQIASPKIALLGGGGGGVGGGGGGGGGGGYKGESRPKRGRPQELE